MNELMEKVYKLEDLLDKEETIKEIRQINKKIKNDKELLKLIEEYRVTGNEETKNKIVNNQLFSKYKHLETELNFIILNIRGELKKITNSKGCSQHENN